MGFWKEQSILRSEGKRLGRRGRGSRYGDVSIDIRLIGDDQLKKQLDRLAGQGRSRIFGAAAKKALRPVLIEVRKNTPVNTGALKKSWRFGLVKTMSARKSGGYVGARILFPRRKDLGIASDAKGYYPASLEFGFEHMGGSYIPPVKMVRNALYGNRVLVFNNLKRELRSRIAKAMRKKGMSVPEGFGE